MPTSKMSRPTNDVGDNFELDDGFDFGEPEVIPVEIAKDKYLYLKEPCAEDLIKISEISENTKISEIEATLQTICILHAPQDGSRKLSLKDAKRLTAKQLKSIGRSLSILLGGDEDEEEEKL